MRITNLTTGEVREIVRSAGVDHPAWVHKQCDTGSESELQRCLDQYNVEDFYDEGGKHRGPDIAGVELFRQSNRVKAGD